MRRVEDLSLFVKCSTGIFMAIIRLYEPVFFQLLKNFIYECFGILNKESQGKI
jgi:hypothetical protein